MDLGQDLIIVLLGSTGAGKSASGNSILGRPAFESRRAFTSVTKTISEPTNETVFGKKISVVDTPGILGCERGIQTRCLELLQSTAPCLFLVVVKIDRFTPEQKNAVEAAIDVIGDQLSNSYLLFTGGDDLDNMTLDEFISDDPEGQLKPLVERFEGRHHLFNNKNGGQEQVRELLEKSGHLTNAAPPSTVRRIVLLGLPGVGKSSSGNTILGSDQFTTSCGFNPVSTETVSKSAPVQGRQVTVVDTPGVTGEALSPKQLYLEIMKSIAETSPGPHAFIIVVKLSRISEADIKLFEMVERLFSSDALQYAMVLFTYGDELRGQSIDALIQANRCVSELVSRCGGRYCVFDNTRRGNRVQVKQCLDKIHEMVTANQEKPFTSEMFKRAQAGTMYLYVKWTEIHDWFIQLLHEMQEIIKKISFSSGENNDDNILMRVFQ